MNFIGRRMLELARQRGVAVVGLDSFIVESARAVVRAADAVSAPVFLQVSLQSVEHMGLGMAAGVVLDVRETVAPPQHGLPVVFNDPYHKPHLENFFNAIRGNAELNCPAEIGYETAVTVLKVNEAVETGRKLNFKPDEFFI